LDIRKRFESFSHGIIYRFYRRRSAAMRILNTFVLVLGACLLAGQAEAEVVLVGTLSYDTFIPGDADSPGIDAFNLSNLTGGFALPTDFPVSDALTFQSATLTLTFSDLLQEVFDLGDIDPGFLLDPDGNPIVQVSGDQVFSSAEFNATLSAGIFALFDGTSFVADSPTLDVELLPSGGSALVADTDQTAIAVSGTVASTPEPSSLLLASLPCLVSAEYLRRKWAGRAN
jgi:hypothetical protein